VSRGAEPRAHHRTSRAAAPTHYVWLARLRQRRQANVRRPHLVRSGNTESPTELIMSRTLILIAAPSLVVTSLALSAAQQLPNVTPGMVEMTEPPTPATAGFNNRTNGFAEQAQFDRDRKAFEEVETILPETKDDNGARLRKRRSSENPPSISENSEAGGGLGPVYNATSCVSCHQNPITGSSSQVSEIRAGHRDPNTGILSSPRGARSSISAQSGPKSRSMFVRRTMSAPCECQRTH
jgi:Di-haem oxidoreductase, putative peroxidase